MSREQKDEKKNVYDRVTIRNIFLKESKVQEHVDAIQNAKSLYISELKTMIERRVTLNFSSVGKARILAACLAAGTIGSGVPPRPKNSSGIEISMSSKPVAIGPVGGPVVPGGPIGDKEEEEKKDEKNDEVKKEEKTEEKKTDEQKLQELREERKRIKKEKRKQKQLEKRKLWELIRNERKEIADKAKEAKKQKQAQLSLVEQCNTDTKDTGKGIKGKRGKEKEKEKQQTNTRGIAKSSIVIAYSGDRGRRGGGKQRGGRRGGRFIRGRRGGRRGGRGGRRGGRGGRRKPVIADSEKAKKEEEQREKERTKDYASLKKRMEKKAKEKAMLAKLLKKKQQKEEKEKPPEIKEDTDEKMKDRKNDKSKKKSKKWEAKDIADILLMNEGFAGIAEVLKAAQLLDSGRRIKQEKKRLTKLEALKRRNDDAVRTKTITELKTTIHNLEQETIVGASLTGAKIKKIRKWVQSIPAETLEFFLLNYPTEPWRNLADLCHLRQSDFQVDYFLPFVFGAPPPRDSLYTVALSVTSSNLKKILTDYPRLAFCYSYLRKKLKEHREARANLDEKVSQYEAMGFSRKQALVAIRRGVDVQQGVDWILENTARIDGMPDVQEEIKEDMDVPSRMILARLAPLEDLLWFYEELQCTQVEEIIYQRLLIQEAMKENARSTYGKLTERLLFFREKKIKFAPQLLPYAEERLAKINIPQSQISVAVLGDASGSMQVAIKCASALGSLLSAVLKADLLFFNSASFPPPILPRTAQGVVEVVEKVKAEGSTSMAAALYPYYQRRQTVDLFVLVSDEGENTAFAGHMFTDLFLKYREHVHPLSKVILVSFLPVGEKGTIKERLEAVGIDALQFRLDKERPDTSKFDSLLGIVTLQTTHFQERYDCVESVLVEKFNFPRAVFSVIMEY